MFTSRFSFIHEHYRSQPKWKHEVHEYVRAWSQALTLRAMSEVWWGREELRSLKYTPSRVAEAPPQLLGLAYSASRLATDRATKVDPPLYGQPLQPSGSSERRSAGTAQGKRRNYSHTPLIPTTLTSSPVIHMIAAVHVSGLLLELYVSLHPALLQPISLIARCLIYFRANTLPRSLIPCILKWVPVLCICFSALKYFQSATLHTFPDDFVHYTSGDNRSNTFCNQHFL